jgi:lipopolysaccharide/colanic/teichoic acid biosynthesis glycosyltransferase
MATTVLGAHLPRHSRYWFVQAHDVIVTVIGFLAAFVLRSGFALDPGEQLAMLISLLALSLIAALSYHGVGLYRGVWSHTSVGDILVVVKGATLVTLLFLTFLFFFNELHAIPRSVPLIHWFVVVVLLSGSRLLHAWRRRRQLRFAVPTDATAAEEPALLVGCNPTTALYLTGLRTQPGPYRIVGILDDDRGQFLGRTLHQVPVIGRIEEADRCIQELAVHGVFARRIVIVSRDPERVAAALAALAPIEERFGLKIDVLSDDFWRDQPSGEPPPLSGAAVEPSCYLQVRQVIDVTVAAALLVALAPLLALAAVIVLLDVGRPVLFLQVRPGRRLQPFVLAKFRTMRRAIGVNGELLSDTERVSSLGRFLRRTKLDELPQLVSIVKGDMTFIGPRPLLPRDLPPGASARAAVRPGVTGWAQVNGGHQLSNEDKLMLDLWYIANASLLLDLRIIVLTIMTIARGEKINQDELGRALATRHLLIRPSAEARCDGRAPAAPRGTARYRWWARVADFAGMYPK